MTSSEQPLSNDEMAALSGVSVADKSPEEARIQAAKVKVESYNFRQPGRLSVAQLRALKVVHEFFAKRLSEGHSGSGDLIFDLTLVSVETVSYSNFMGSLSNPCFLAQLTSRFEQDTLMEIELPVARMLVGRILGDSGDDEDAGKALTSIEQAIAGNWVEGLLPTLGESWNMSASVDYKLKSIECDPRFVQIMPDDNPVVSLGFVLQSGDLKGQLTLCYSLDQLQELLEGMSLKMSGSADEDTESETGGARILAALKSVPFDLRAELGSCVVRASQLASLRRGDVLCLDRSIHDPVDLYLGNNLVYKGRLGRKGDNLAVQLSSRPS
ncbi:MAG: FliM/FliN family flagellar motor switch protein [Pontiellaceae bacterium]|nr:FliM/FliN family flagellar motor switch protein [Pontiellaceae bacterium]MBN2784124.1 FliM/FliN family flagellar motor switch protein [Pontiellaceae bacterium]